MLFALTACKNESNQDEQRPAQKIDVAAIEETDRLIAPRDLLIDVEYIVLNQLDSFFLTSARKILEFDEKLLILDGNKEELAAYEMNGNLIGRVGKKGRGPEEFMSATDFAVDAARGKILIFSRTDKALIEYNSDLSFSRKIRLDAWAFQMSLLKSGHIALYTNYSGEDENNILIFDLNGNRLDGRMPYPNDREYIPIDYTGFILGNYYTYPLSNKIFKINEDSGQDSVAFEIEFPGRREEEKKFEVNDFLDRRNWMQHHILAKFTVGTDAEEVLFYYSYRSGNETGYSLGVKLASGEVFGHRNLKHGFKENSDPIVRMFFLGPYNLPTYSSTTDSYYVATDIEVLTEYVYNDKETSLTEIQRIDTVLFKTLTALKDIETPVIMKFKLKKRYE